MAEQGIDVLMRVVGPKGPLASDSRTAFTSSETEDFLRKDFSTGFFCELQSFDFTVGVAQNDEDEADKAKAGSDGTGKPAGPGSPPAVDTKPKSTSRTKNNRSLLKNGVVDMQPVSFTRVMDSMSHQLLKAMIDCDTISELSVVKRKFVEADQSGDCYLRIDFKNVLVTELDWKSEDVRMIESGSFIYRDISIRYRPQLPSGKLGAVVSGSWAMKQPGRPR